MVVIIGSTHCGDLKGSNVKRKYFIKTFEILFSIRNPINLKQDIKTYFPEIYKIERIIVNFITRLNILLLLTIAYTFFLLIYPVSLNNMIVF